MPSRRSFPARRSEAAWVAGVTVLLGVFWLISPVGRGLQTASYDRSFSWFGAAESRSTSAPVAIIYLDDASFRALNLDPAHPLPRTYHAHLLDRLTQAGARAIVFDMIFGTASTNAADSALREALRRNGRTLLAAETATGSRAVDPEHALAVVERTLVQPAPELLAVAAGWGLADVQPGEDFVVRRHFAGWLQADPPRPGLAWAVGQLLNLTSVRDVASSHERWIRYRGEPYAVPHVSYYQALETGAVPDEFFRDRVVFVGARPMSGTFPDRRDEFRSPFHTWRRDLFLPGVEVHATQMWNLLDGDWLVRPSPWAELGGVVVFGTLVGFVLVALRPGKAVIGALGAVVLIGLGARVGLQTFGVWFPWLIPVAIQVPVALGGAVFVQWRDWWRTRQRLEAAQRAADARIREQAALIDKAQDAILVQELAGPIRYANPSAERLYGWTAAEFEAGAAKDLFATPEAQAARHAALERGEWNGSLVLRTRAGANRIVESRWTLIRDAQGRPASLLVTGTDVTERRQLEAEAHRAQRTEAIGAVASGMAHDLNNSLAPVLLGVQLLRRDVREESARRLLDLIEAGAQRGAGMVKQVLLFARGQEGVYGRLEPRGLVNEVARLARDTFPRTIHVTTQLPEGIWPIRGNATELHQVLLNLCVNARDAMPMGGTLCLAAENLELLASDLARFPGAVPGSYVSLLVTDTGTGIPTEILPRIFEPYFTTKPEGQGTGLGLSTTARIVRAHGGAIAVTSEAGEGTTFEILLPRLLTEASTGSTAANLSGLGGQGERLLVVDDDAAVLELLRRGLEDHGYRVLAASDPAVAVTRLRSASEPVDLVLCDATLPPVEEGRAFLAVLRELRPELPVIVMTGSVAEVENHSAGAGREIALPKPVVWETLLGAVRRVLSQGAAVTLTEGNAVQRAGRGLEGA